MHTIDNSYLKNLIKDKNLTKVIIIFIICKILILLAAIAGFFVPSEFSAQKDWLDNKFLNLFVQYDGSAYLDIAEHGYNAEYDNGAGNYHFFPLYPIMIKSLSFIFGYGWSAFLISNILSFLAVILLYVVIKEDFGEKVAKYSLIYFLLFPVAYFFSMMYTESLFLVLILLMLYFAKKDRWLLVGIFGFLAMLTRMFGIIMILPTLYIYVKNRNFKKIDFKILYLLLIPLALFSLYSYMYFTTGNFFIQFGSWAKPQYGFKLTIPGWDVGVALIEIFQTTSINLIIHSALNVLFAILFITATVFSFRLKKEYGIFMAAYLLLAVAHTTVNANIRYYMLMFPAYILLARQEDKRIKIIIPYVCTISVILMVLFTIRFVNVDINTTGLFNHILNGVLN